jgi:arylsulfatase A-like enzyme
LSSRGDWKGPACSVVSGGWKLVLFAGNQYPAEVYDLTTDPAERYNLGLSARPELLDLIADWRERIPEGAGESLEGVDEETLRTLESLGYVGD